jgi:hypothetical protein
MPALSFTEHMSGTFYLLAEPLRERKIALDFEAHVRTQTASLTGRLRAEGFATSPVQGTIDARALAEKRIPYDLSFVGDDGQRYRLRGEKDLSWLAPIETLVVLHFTIGRENDAWTEIARGTMRTHADVHSLREMVRSLRASPF